MSSLLAPRSTAVGTVSWRRAAPRAAQGLRGLLGRVVLALPLSLAPQGLCGSRAAAQKPPASPGPSGTYGEKDLLPLDAVLAVIEDQPILASQIQARLQMMRALAGPAETAVSPDQAQRELFEARLIAWDAARLRLETQDSDVERLLDAMATQQGMKGGRAELLSAVRARGIDASAYQASLRQALLAARWEATFRPLSGTPATPPAPTKAQRLAAIEAEALIDRPEGLLDKRPLPQRTCQPATPPRALSPSPSKEPVVAAVCIEGAAGPDTEVRLAELVRKVAPQAPLSRDAVARSLTELLASPTGAEAASVYGLPLRPGGDPGGPLLIVYRIRPRPLLSGIELEGAPEGVAIPPVSIPPNTRYFHRELRSQREDLVQALHDTGYLDAAARAERLPRRSESEPLRVRLTLMRGLRTHVARITLPGVAAARASEALAVLGVRAGEPLSETALLIGRNKLGDFYAERGFVKAHVERHATEPAAPREDGSPQVAVRMAVTEGKQYRLGVLKLAGTLPIPEAELRKLVATQRGELFRPSALRRDVERMSEAGRRVGKSVTIEVSVAFSEAAALIDLTLTFSPAPPSPATP